MIALILALIDVLFVAVVIDLICNPAFWLIIAVILLWVHKK